jgi:DNA-binding response OmpR family regulator
MRKRVLIVDDDEEICEEMSEILTDKGYSVRTVFDGIKASELIKKDDFELLLLDLKIPGLSGENILRSARRQGIRARILVLTGRPMKKMLKYGADISKEDESDSSEKEILSLCDGFINKPFDIDNLLKTIKNLIG